MSKYTTGELAKRCHVSVRTVQFYDTKGLLPPTALTDGGRRLYNDEDADKLQLICMLKALGLSLVSIRGIFHSDAPEKILLLLLEEQMLQLQNEIKTKRQQMDAIKIVMENVQSHAALPVNSMDDIGRIMENKKKLQQVHGHMLGIGLFMDALQIAALVLWITKGVWLPFALGMPLVILLSVLLTRMYYQKTAYLCPACHTVFKPRPKEFIFSAHTPKTRKLTCTQCGQNGYCVEVYSESP